MWTVMYKNEKVFEGEWDACLKWVADNSICLYAKANHNSQVIDVDNWGLIPDRDTK